MHCPVVMNERFKHPKLTLKDVLLDDSDPRVVACLSVAQKTKAYNPDTTRNS